MDPSVHRRAVRFVRIPVPVVVGIAGIADRVAVRVGLIGVGNIRAVVIARGRLAAGAWAVAGCAGSVAVGVDVVGVVVMWSGADTTNASITGNAGLEHAAGVESDYPDVSWVFLLDR